MDEGRKPPARASGEGSEFGWRRAAEFLRNLMRLERAVVRLEEENKQLREKVDALQRAVDDHNGQLKAILATMTSTLSHSVEISAERAAIETVMRFLGKSDNDKQ